MLCRRVTLWPAFSQRCLGGLFAVVCVTSLSTTQRELLIGYSLEVPLLTHSARGSTLDFLVRFLVQVTIYRRIRIGRDCHFAQSQAYDTL